MPHRVGPMNIDNRVFYIVRGKKGSTTYSHYKFHKLSTEIEKAAGKYQSIYIHRIDIDGDRCEWNGNEFSKCDGRSLPKQNLTEAQIWSLLEEEYERSIA